ncbi:MAG TPA: hypothetical protein VJT75_01235, partial [Thermoleophilaceae bacterium]|nr:hypothetical protein [Thermoleophilaceae bacterium]
GRPCRALETLEDLRGAIRRSAAPRVRGVYGAEAAILATTDGARCGNLSRHVKIDAEPPLLGGVIVPLPRVRKTPEEDEGVEVEHEVAHVRPPRPGPPTSVTPVAPGAPYATGSDPFAFTTLSAIGQGIFGIPEEPSQATAGRVVWYTGNSGGAAYSLDGGATFKKVDPREVAPEGDNAFCCDQVVVYAPQINRFIWYIQYWCRGADLYCESPGNSNLGRLLVASPEEIRKDPVGAWTTWTLRPGMLGHPGVFLDYPDLGVGTNSLYVTMNMFKGDGFTGSLAARVPLADLKAGRALDMRFYRDPHAGTFKVVQGLRSRAFLATQSRNTKLMTLSWDERSPLLMRHHTPHAVSADTDYESPTGAAGGVDWGERSDARITAATLRGDELWLAWPEGRDICTDRCVRFWPQPHVHVAVIDSRTWRLRRERFIHNPSFAIGFPSLATDARGRVGLSFSYGSGTAGNASPAAGYLTGGEAFRQVARSPGAGYQGDYFSLRPDWPNGNRFVGTGYVTDRGGEHVRWLYYRYSRPR